MTLSVIGRSACAMVALVCFGGLACGTNSSTPDSAGAANGGSANAGAPSGGSATGGSTSGTGGKATGGSSTGGGSTGGGSTGTGGSGITLPMKIMPVGDSITRATCWRAVLWSKLNTNHAGDFDFSGTLQSDAGCSPSTYDKDNQGYGSSLVTEIVAGITNTRTCDPLCPTISDLGTAFTAKKPDVILMHFGTNDVWNGISPANILTAYSAVIDRARQANPKIHFLVAQIIPMNPSGCGECGARVQALNAQIPGWAKGKTTAQSPIIVVDQWTGFNAATDTRDGVHPNDSGSLKMATKWQAALAPLF